MTGGAGFIGSHLAERLARGAHEVLVIDNLSSGTDRLPLLEAAGVEIDTTDIRQEKLTKVVGSFGPRAVFHLAAQTQVPASVADPVFDAKLNVIGALRVLEAARETGARVIFASSGGAIYGDVDPSRLPVRESELPRPVSPYGITKAVTGDYLRFYLSAHGLAFVNLALANVYGPRQGSRGEAGVVAIFARTLLSGQECVIFGDGGHTRDFVFVGDVVEAFIAGIDRGEGETINIGSEIETTIEDLYTRMAAICGVERPPRHAPERPGDVRRSVLDITKARRVLAWRPEVSLEEGLRLTIDAFRRSG